MKYELMEIKPQFKTFEIFIKADSNDGDYISTLNSYTEKEFNTKIIDELILLQSKYSGPHRLKLFDNAVYDLYGRETELSIPYSDLDYVDLCHTLKELRVTCIDTDGKVYNVKLNSLE